MQINHLEQGLLHDEEEFTEVEGSESGDEAAGKDYGKEHLFREDAQTECSRVVCQGPRISDGLYLHGFE